jgi:hypothetical protein
MFYLCFEQECGLSYHASRQNMSLLEQIERLVADARCWSGFTGNRIASVIERDLDLLHGHMRFLSGRSTQLVCRSALPDDRPDPEPFAGHLPRQLSPARPGQLASRRRHAARDRDGPG